MVFVILMGRQYCYVIQGRRNFFQNKIYRRVILVKLSSHWDLRVLLEILSFTWRSEIDEIHHKLAAIVKGGYDFITVLSVSRQIKSNWRKLTSIGQILPVLNVKTKPNYHGKRTLVFFLLIGRHYCYSRMAKLLSKLEMKNNYRRVILVKLLLAERHQLTLEQASGEAPGGRYCKRDDT